MLKRYFRILAREAATDYKRKIFEMLKKNPRARLLDCGCGEGNFTLEVARKIGTKNILEIEISERNRKKAWAKGTKSFPYDLNKKIPLERVGVWTLSVPRFVIIRIYTLSESILLILIIISI